jgi:hypothetical protein
MKRTTSGGARERKQWEALVRYSFGGDVKSSFFLVLAGLVFLSSCGGSSSSSSTPSGGTLGGNWQFTMAPPTDSTFVGGLQGGFLLQKQGSVTGGVTYSVLVPSQEQGGIPTLCNSGSAPVTGTISGQSVTLTAAAGAQTFTLTGTLTGDGSTMAGTYSSTDGAGCGTVQTALQWSAISIPPLTGSVQGNLHSVLSSPNPVLDTSLRDQDFPITGTLTQGANLGASNATVTGTLSFQGYPCLDVASVNGTISGTSVILQIFAFNGLNVGQIGAPAGFSNPSPVVFGSSAGGTGAVLQGANGYGVTTINCPGGIIAGDIGNVCLAIGNATGCTQPILLSPASLTFPAQQVGSAPTSQTLTLTNTDPSGATLSGLSLLFSPQAGNTSLFGASDFDGLPNFTSQDTCANSPGSTFSLAPQQSCSITIAFSPQQSCPWLPSVALGGEPPSLCPFPLFAKLTVNSPVSADSDTAFAVPITGAGFSTIVPSTPELDFGAEALSEASPPQLLSFINQGTNSVQILPALSSVCVNPPVGVLTLPRPLSPGVIAGLQVDTGVITPNGSTINYNCDSDLTSKQPNFQLSADNCTGTLLAPQQSCSLQVSFVPQPSTPLIPALDYFLELNTLQCTSSTTSNCEIDSGRFPVELTANVPSPLRMSPGAGLNFGNLPVGQLSDPLTVTLFNDPNDPNPGTVNFTGNLVKGDYAETDDCGSSLTPGSSCTLTVTFKPKILGFDPGAITITYTVGQTQIIHLRGTGTVVPAIR